MISDIVSNLTVLNIFGALASFGLLFHIFQRLRYHYRFYKAGNVAAPKIANDPVTALPWLYTIGKAQVQNRLLQLFTYLLDTYTTRQYPNVAEINVIGSQRYLFTREPEHIKTLLTSKFADYGKGEEFHRVWQPFLGDSIFTTDHQQWQDSRNLIRPMFMKTRVSDLEIFEKWTSIMIDKFAPSGQTFNLQELFYRMTIDVITEFLLGESVGSLQNPRSEFVKAFGFVQYYQTILTVLIPIEKLVPRSKYLKGIKVIEEFITPFIDKTLSLPPNELEKLSKSEKEFTFLHAMANFTRDPKVIRDQLIAVLLAGRDTTAATLSWAFYELSHSPKSWAKLRKEVLNVVGPNRQPTYEDLKNLKYVNNVLNETLRLYPAVPFNIRSALVDTSLPSCNPEVPDISIVKGDAIFYATIGMQRRQDLYPPPSPEFAAANVFQPERWEIWQPKPWQYVPFNGGPRICVGQNFALTEMAYVIVRMAQRFERMEYRGTGEQSHKVEIVGTPAIPIQMAFWEAQKQ